MKKSVWIIALVIIILIGAYFIFNPKEINNHQETMTDEATVDANNAAQKETKVFTLAEVAKYNTEDNCWLAINGKVYDATSYIPSHPGGKAIVEGCGKDATELFETRPMGSGTPHSDRARDALEKLYIGDLKK